MERDEIKTLSAWLAHCEDKPPVTGRFPSWRVSSNEVLLFGFCCGPVQNSEQAVGLLVIWDAMMRMSLLP